MENFLLAIDVGTTSTKGLAVLPDGSILAQAQKEYSTHYFGAGHAEQDPLEIVDAVIGVIAAIIDKTGSDGLLGISFSAAMHSLLAVDGDGNPLTPVIIWADIRSVEQAKALRGRDLGKEIYHLSGTPIHPMTPLCKLLWIKQKQKAIFAEAYKFISIKEFLFARWFGEYVCDYSIASGGGLFDHGKLRWLPEALELAGINESRLSMLVPTDRKFSGLSTALAGRMKIPQDTPFIIGASDGCLAHWGCGAINPGDVSVTIGTSGAIRMMASTYKYDEQCRIFNYRLDGKKYVVGGATNNGAVLLSWFAENIERVKPDSRVFIEEAFSVPGSEGLVFLPYLLGERAPIYDALAKGVFFGIGVQHNRAHFKRAVLEGICWGLKSTLVALEEVVHPAGRILASGGFVQSDLWVQLLADILGKPVTVDSRNDASALGAALVGFEALGIKADFHRTDGSGKVFQPDEKKRLYYQKLFEIVESLYEKLKDDFAKLNDLNYFGSKN